MSTPGDLIWTVTMNPCIDLFTEVQEMEPRRKLRASAPRRQPGGGGINVARAINRLEGTALALFPAGGLTGSHIRELLEREGVMSHSISTTDVSRENLAVLDRSSGNQYRFVMPGPQLEKQEWSRFLELIEDVAPTISILVASGSLPGGVPEDFYAQLARICKATETRLLLDASGAPLKKALDEGVYLVKPNLREFGEITDSGLETTDEQRDACRELISSGAADVIALTLGKAGACIAWPDGFFHSDVPQVKVQSTIGAGDSSMAGIALGLSRGWDIPRTFLLALAAGTAAVKTPASELCEPEEVEALFERLLEDNRERL